MAPRKIGAFAVLSTSDQELTQPSEFDKSAAVPTRDPEPIRPEDPGRSAAVPPRDPESTRPAEPRASGRWQKTAREAAQQTGQEPEPQARVNVHPAEFPVMLYPAPRRSLAAGRGERSGPPASASFAPQEGDDVQIHIGRIEVTAAPPAVAPAVRKPVRKSLNLDEYLKRSR